MTKGDIYLVDMSVARVGHEQTGTRPTVIAGTVSAGIVPIIPLTSNRRASRFKYIVSFFPIGVISWRCPPLPWCSTSARLTNNGS